MAELQRPIFESEDLVTGLKAFIEHNGPGHAVFQGR
jgi:hypothetical protein